MCEFNFIKKTKHCKDNLNTMCYALLHVTDANMYPIFYSIERNSAVDTEAFYNKNNTTKTQKSLHNTRMQTNTNNATLK